jgi:excisionase family DNA binding protein
MTTDTKLAYRPKEAAAATGMSRETIFKAIAAGHLRSAKCGAARLIPADALREWIDNMPSDQS